MLEDKTNFTYIPVTFVPTLIKKFDYNLYKIDLIYSD